MTELNDIGDSPWLALLENASDGVVVVAHGPWRVIRANETIANWVGRPADELRNRPIGDLFGAEGAGALAEQLDDVWDEAAPNSTFLLAPPPATTLTGPLTIHLQRLPIGGAVHVAMLVRDESAGDTTKAEVDRLCRDPLTGLPDRSALMRRMTELLGGGRLADQQFAVLFIDLNDFKQVNDVHGHLVGDRVLGEVGRRLAACVRTRDMIVRFGGDEFVALVEHISGWQGIEPVVERIHAALTEPIALPEGDVTLSVSVGVAEASVEHSTPEDLLRAADRAMYASKRAGS